MKPKKPEKTNVKKDTRRNIKVSAENYQKLKKLGYFGDSFDDIIERLIKKQIHKIKKEDKPKYTELVDM